MASYEYEFKKAEETIINDLSKTMRFVGLFLYVLGLLTIGGGLLKGILDNDYVFALDSIITGVVIFLVALWTNNAAKCFKKITQGKGSDIKNLMDAFKEIRNLYRFKFWLWFMSVVYVIAIAFI